MFERCDVRHDAGTQSFQAVAAFQHRYNSPARMFFGDIEHDPGEIREIVVREEKPSQRVAQTRVKTCGDEHQIGLELVSGGDQLPSEGIQYFLSRPGRQRTIQRRTFAAAFTRFGSRAGTWIPGRLVSAEEEYGPVIVKNILSTVSVVDIPIDNQNSLCTVLFLRVPGSDW